MTWHEALAAEWLRAVRGARSQRAVSRRLGYKTNIAYRWEAGACFPSASDAFAAMARLNFDVSSALASFLPAPGTGALEPRSLSRPQEVACFLDGLRQGQTYARIAELSGLSRFRVARYMRGEAEPRLPEFLALVDVCSLRLLDFVAAFFGEASLPSLAARSERLRAVREAAYDAPMSHAVLRFLELQRYREGRHQHGLIAAQLGISREDEQRYLQLLQKAGQVRWDGHRYRVVEQLVTDTGADPARARELQAFWARHAADTMTGGAAGGFAFNLMTVSEADYQRLRALQVEYFAAMRDIVAASSPDERVVLMSWAIVPLDDRSAEQSG